MNPIGGKTTKNQGEATQMDMIEKTTLLEDLNEINYLASEDFLPKIRLNYN